MQNPSILMNLASSPRFRWYLYLQVSWWSWLKKLITSFFLVKVWNVVKKLSLSILYLAPLYPCNRIRRTWKSWIYCFIMKNITDSFCLQICAAPSSSGFVAMSDLKDLQARGSYCQPIVPVLVAGLILVPVAPALVVAVLFVLIKFCMHCFPSN